MCVRTCAGICVCIYTLYVYIYIYIYTDIEIWQNTTYHKRNSTKILRITLSKLFKMCMNLTFDLLYFVFYILWYNNVCLICCQLRDIHSQNVHYLILWTLNGIMSNINRSIESALSTSFLYGKSYVFPYLPPFTTYQQMSKVLLRRSMQRRRKIWGVTLLDRNVWIYHVDHCWFFSATWYLMNMQTVTGKHTQS